MVTCYVYSLKSSLVLVQVTVQAGIKVGDLCTKLEAHGLTLQNLASIAEQQAEKISWDYAPPILTRKRTNSCFVSSGFFSCLASL